jgi:hypothetical protein
MTSTAMQHLRHLAESIGPRGSTTAQEQEAATYLRERFEAAGLETHWEPFTAPVSGWRPFALAALAGLASVALTVAAGRAGALVAALLMTVATVSVFLEMYFRPNPLRAFVRRGQSQNVWARVPASQTPRRRVLLVGHLDTHRTPWTFVTPLRLVLLRAVTGLGVAAFVLGTAFFVVVGVFDLGALHPYPLLLVPVYLAVLAITVQPDTTPYTHGANDNASGASVVLSLAERLAREPLAHTEVWALGSGCEEVGSYGSQAFIARHRDELPGLLVISIDNVGGAGAGVCYTSVEGMVFPLRPSPELFALAESLRREYPEGLVYARPYTVLHTDATAFMSHGVPSLSFVGLTSTGVIPDWHQVCDTLDRVDSNTVERTEAFVFQLLERIDAGQPAGGAAPATAT